MKPTSKVAIILGGGVGKRIGQKKAFTSLAGKPLLTHVAGKVMMIVSELVVVIGADDDIEAFKRILPKGTLIVKDEQIEVGPLMGIYVGMKQIHSAYALVVSCDTPFISPKILNLLLKNVRGYDALIPKWEDGRIEPLQAAYRVRTALKAAKVALDTGELSNIDMIKRLHSVSYLPIEQLRDFDPHLLSFLNINYRRDLAKAERIIQQLEAD